MNNYDKLVNVLKEIFLLDQSDLDFGIFRIMNQKHNEIENFLTKELIPQAKEILQKNVSSDTADVQNELAKLTETLKAAGMNPDDSPKVKELKAKLKGNVDIEALENEVFSHLAAFFKRYYDKGDFISMRRYKKDVYAIPYEGEEVKLHWANQDQYYIKSSEYLKNYSFILPSEQKVNFVLVEASTEQNNNKAQGNQERRFAISSDKVLEAEGNELNIFFTYDLADKSVKQKDLLDNALEAIKANLPAEFKTALNLSPTEKNSNRTILEKHLTDYTARNTFDYFIHKDLGGFFRRELDFYIKNEVLFIDDLNTRDEKEFLKNLSVIKAIKLIGEKVIIFLAQLEEFQKKLWLKKKFIIDANYCITLDKIPEEYYPEIAANQEQLEEWKRLFAVDEIKADAVTLGYEEPVSVDFLKQNPFLLLDTKFFSEEFKENLLSEFDDIENETDGILINADNAHALSLIEKNISQKVSNIFIDPPYNTDDDGFIYKDNFQSSTWLSMMNDRVDRGIKVLSEDGVFFVSIGDEEQEHLATLLRHNYGKNNFFADLIWEKKKKGSFLSGQIARMKDYILCVSKDIRNFSGLVGEIASDTETYPCVNASNPREIRKIPPGISSKFRERNYTLKSGEIISAGNMNLVLHSDLVIQEGILMEELIIEGNWRYSQDSMKEYADNKELYITQDLYLRRIVSEPRFKRMKDLLPRLGNEGESDFRAYDINDLGKYGWGTNEDANEELHQLLGEQYAASYPKPSKLITLLLASSRHNSGYWVDYFAGSGTTAHAVLNLNRTDKGKRKYILVEMGEYFNSVTKPRVQKVIYSKNWNGGKPVSREGSSQLIKYFSLEGYEDALNNLKVKRDATQEGIFAQGGAFKEDYILSYMLDFETEGSLLSADIFTNPFDYKLNITRNNQTSYTKVDLVETFNYLIGLQVETVSRIRGFKVVTGKNREDEKVLVIWRNLNEKSNDDLNDFFVKQSYNTRDSEFDRIFVNGDNNLENLKVGDEKWKVMLIEEEFKKRMFDIKEI